MFILQRYYHYVNNGILEDMLAPPDREVMVRIHSLIPNTLLTSIEFHELNNDLLNEVHTDYQMSLRKGIG